jgi:hypothetical protein
MPRNASEFGSRRKYTVRNIDYPSVTTVLGLGRPKEWLGYWAAKEVAGEAEAGVEAHGPLAIEEWVRLDRELHQQTKTHIERHKNKCPHVPSAIGYLKGTPWRKRDAAGDAGTARHKTLEALAAGTELPEEAPAREQLEAWRDGYRPLILESEAQVVNLVAGYAGSLDLIAEVYGKRLLIDLKTMKLYTDKGERKKPDRDWCLQLAAYRYATSIFEDDRLWEMPEVEGGAVLWIPQDEPDQWMFFELPAGAEEYRAFMAAKATYDDFTTYEKQSLGEQILPRAMEEVA